MQSSSTPSSRGFWCLAALQAQGAFNDNAIKLMLVLYASLLFSNNPQKQNFYNNFIPMLIPLAFLIFSCWAGFLADKFSKWAVTMTVKSVELTIMFIFFLVFRLTARDGGIQFGTLAAAVAIGFLFFTHSAFFSPSKYGIIPELVPPERVAWANGIISMTTYLAIIGGTIFSNELFEDLKPHRLYWIPVILIGFSLGGLLLGLGVTRTPRANPDRAIPFNFLPELKRYFGILFSDRVLGLTVAGLAYFWGTGIVMLSNVLTWGMYSLKLSEVWAGRLYFLLALGIGAGSALAGLISRNRIETGLIPLGSLGIFLFALPLAFANPHIVMIMVICLFLVGVSAGFFSVPLFALLQTRTEKADRGGLLAAANYCSDTSMVLYTALVIVLIKLFKFTPNMIFALVSVLTLAATYTVVRLMPDALLRLITLVFFHLFYRVRTMGLDNVPAQGPALLVSNHVSFIDAILLSAVTPRPIRFIVWEGLYRRRLLRWFLKTMQCIPVGSEQRPRDLIASLRQAAEKLKNGEAICIFAEGEISRIGMMLPLRRGYEIILKEAPAPVVPVYLSGVWGSIFSFDRGKFFWKWPRRIPYRVRVGFGRPLPPAVKAFDLRQALEELGAEVAIAAKPDLPLLHQLLIRSSRRHWGKFLLTDVLSPPVTFGQALWRSMILARRLAPEWAGQEMVGIMLPSTVGGALVNYAATLAGRVAVNLNYTSGQTVLNDCARRADLRTVVTARPFLQKMGLEPPARAIYVEDYRGYHGLLEVIMTILAARFAPASLVLRLCRAAGQIGPDSPAAIIFSSGSTGEPKGIMLSHFNIMSDIDSIHQALRLAPNDRLLGALPFFHSFGYTVGLWAGLAFPFATIYHFSPLDVKIIGELCQKHEVTLMVTTPTFLQTYLRRIQPAQFGGLNCVITGAERLPERLRAAFQERYGIEPLQGYGTTECAPVVSTNVDDFHAPGFYQLGHKRGSIGRPLPGIAVRVIHPESGAPMPQGESGLLLVRGANVMQGYLGMAEKTAEVLKDGWYNTGDVAYLDEDGFIFITDRLSRFSKIGGEMVPHLRLEEKLNEALGLSEPSLVVTSVPDERKGEQLVVLHVLDEEALAGVNERLAEAGVPNLWIPRREMYFKIEALPLLGSGKLDLAAVKKIAAEKAGEMGKG